MSAESLVRSLLLRVGTEPALCDELEPDTELLAAGIDSAQLIELTLLIEDELDAELTAEEVERVTTLRDIAALLEARSGRG